MIKPIMLGVARISSLGLISLLLLAGASVAVEAHSTASGGWRYNYDPPAAPSTTSLTARTAAFRTHDHGAQGAWLAVAAVDARLAAEGAEGFSTFVRDEAGRVKKYTTYGRSDPRDPVPFRPVKRFDRDGKPHFNKVTGEYVPTPHVHDPTAPGGVRPPRPDEIPR
jgi:hypothetical protein